MLPKSGVIPSDEVGLLWDTEIRADIKIADPGCDDLCESKRGKRGKRGKCGIGDMMGATAVPEVQQARLEPRPYRLDGFAGGSGGGGSGGGSLAGTASMGGGGGWGGDGNRGVVIITFVEGPLVRG